MSSNYSLNATVVDRCSFDGRFEYFSRRSPIQYINLHYVYPVQFFVGVLGNLINLLVLCSAPMRKSKANRFLVAMASADILFLLALMPVSLATFVYSHPYHAALSYMKHHLIALANWFSSASTWLIVGVTVERLCAIRRPMRSLHGVITRRQLNLLLVAIFGLAGVLTFHDHIADDCTPLPYCGSWYYRCVGTANPLLAAYASVSRMVNIVLASALPVVLLFVLNGLLLFSLRQRDHLLDSCHSSVSRRSEGSASDRQRRFSHHAKVRARKVTAMVAMIVTCFTLTNVPSLVVFLYHYANGFSGQMSRTFYAATSISNSLIVTGKALNFFIFCTSSSHFRRRLADYFAHRAAIVGGWLSVGSAGVEASARVTTAIALQQRRSVERLASVTSTGQHSRPRCSSMVTNGRRSSSGGHDSALVVHALPPKLSFATPLVKHRNNEPESSTAHLLSASYRARSATIEMVDLHGARLSEYGLVEL